MPPDACVAPRCYIGEMGTPISQRELRNDNAEVMRRLESGETFTVTRRGIPIADLVPHRPGGAARFVPAAAVVDLLRDLPDWGAEAFAAEQAGLDQLVDDEPRDPWR